MTCQEKVHMLPQVDTVFYGMFHWQMVNGSIKYVKKPLKTIKYIFNMLS